MRISTEENVSLKYNEAIAAQYLKYYRQMADTFGLRDDISVSVLGRCPEVFTMEEQTVDEKEIWAVLEVALKQACEQFVESRITEGERLKEDLFDKLDGMIRDVDAIEDRYPQIMTEYREKLTLKVEELLGDAADGRRQDCGGSHFICR